MTRVSVPEHIPQNLVVNVDFYKLALSEEDIFEAWKRLSVLCRNVPGADAGLVYTPENGGHWIAATGEALEALFPDTENLSNSSIAIPAHEGLLIVPGEADGDMHKFTRRAVMQWFTPIKVRAMREPIGQIVEELIAELYQQGECEFMSEMAFNLPMHLFLRMMALPIEDGPMLLNLVNSVIREGEKEKKIAAMSAIFKYLEDVIDQRLVNPGDDLISHLCKSEYDGGPMPRNLVHSMCVNLLLGGLDTVASMLGFIMKYLAEDKPLREKLASNPELIEGALQEFTRRFAVTSLGRVVAKDFTYKGVELRAGERVLLATPLHGMDEQKFGCPMKVDIDRKIPLVMSFGRGSHQCVGSFLARIELAEALAGWLRHIPDFHIADGKEPRVSCGAVNAMEYLPLKWSVK